MKVLYITPHLSTGGAPRYLLEKIKFPSNKDTNFVLCNIEKAIYGFTLLMASAF